MNELINKISGIFVDDSTVNIYSYDNKICLYGICFSHMEIRNILNVIEGENILIEINANANNKVCIQLIMRD